MWNETRLFAVAVLLALALPAAVALKRLWRERKAETVTVEVSEIEEVRENNKSRYYPVLTVTDGPREGVSWRSEKECDPATFRVGEQLEAKYFPQTGEIDASKRTWQDWLPLFAPILFVLGLLVLGK